MVNLENEVTYISVFASADKRIWLLIWAQACVQFALAALWILWAPTVVVSFLLLIVYHIIFIRVGSGML